MPTVPTHFVCLLTAILPCKPTLSIIKSEICHMKRFCLLELKCKKIPPLRGGRKSWYSAVSRYFQHNLIAIQWCRISQNIKNHNYIVSWPKYHDSIMLSPLWTPHPYLSLKENGQTAFWEPSGQEDFDIPTLLVLPIYFRIDFRTSKTFIQNNHMALFHSAYQND